MLKFGGSSCLIWDPEWGLTNRQTTSQARRRPSAIRYRNHVRQSSKTQYSATEEYRRILSIRPTGLDTRLRTQTSWKAQYHSSKNCSAPFTYSRRLAKTNAEWGSRTLRQACSLENQKAQCAFKILMIHEVLQFALRIAFRCVLHRCGNLDIHRWKL